MQRLAAIVLIVAGTIRFCAYISSDTMTESWQGMLAVFIGMAIYRLEDIYEEMGK